MTFLQEHSCAWCGESTTSLTALCPRCHIAFLEVSERGSVPYIKYLKATAEKDGDLGA